MRCGKKDTSVLVAGSGVALADCGGDAAAQANALLRAGSLRLFLALALVLVVWPDVCPGETYSGLPQVSASDEAEAERGADLGELIKEAAFGVFAHDRGFASDRHEDGIDINAELLFQPPRWRSWQAIGAPSPHLGLTLNLSGETSALYGGVTYTFGLGKRMIVAAAAGLALHNGPLHQSDSARCKRDSDCGFGSRIIPRVALELGGTLGPRHALTLLWSHMSHGGTFADENEGVDAIGLRYHRSY
jgi:lipid A 3-O-deacylase